MKSQFLILMVIGLLFSCNKDNNATDLENQIIGNWKLIKMTNSMSNSETSGSEMEWQETYQLFSDGTFLKSRDKDGNLTEVSGTFNFINNSNGALIELTFDTQSDIIGSCTANKKENLNLQSDTIFTNSWNACDGPTLKYKKN